MFPWLRLRPIGAIPIIHRSLKSSQNRSSAIFIDCRPKARAPGKKTRPLVAGRGLSSSFDGTTSIIDDHIERGALLHTARRSLHDDGRGVGLLMRSSASIDQAKTRSRKGHDEHELQDAAPPSPAKQAQSESQRRSREHRIGSTTFG